MFVGFFPSAVSAGKRAAIAVFIAVCVLAGLVVLTGCGSDATVRSAKGEASTEAGSGALPTGLSSSNDLSLTAIGADRFVLVDGGAGTGQRHTSTIVYELTPDGSKVLARIDESLRTPKAWVGGDGSVVIVGMECAHDGDSGPACPDAPLIALKLDTDGATKTWPLGISTDASVGFAAGPFGKDGLAVVTLDPDGRKPHVATATTTGSRATDLGTVDLRLPAAALVCRTGNRTYLFPADLSSARQAPAMFQITPHGLQQAGQVEAKLGDVTKVSGCSTAGDVLVNALHGDSVERSLVNVSKAGDSRPLDLKAPYATGMVSLTRDGRLVAWTDVKEREKPEGSDVWRLSERRGGTWEPLGHLESAEPPVEAALGASSAAAVVPVAGGSAVKILGK